MADGAPVAESPDPPKDNLAKYREHIQAADQKSQEDFDKTVLSLSGGALGISLVFLKDVVSPNPVVEPYLLFTAWVAWASSTFVILLSFYLSHLALKKIIKQIDAKTIRKERPGGWYKVAIIILNPVGGILFLVGVIAIILFAGANFKTTGVPNVSTQATTTTTITTTAPATTAPGAAAGRKGPPNNR